MSETLPHSASDSAAPSAMGGLTEVRYFLPQMLAELKLERTTGHFGMEKLGQNEIEKFFKSKTPRRAKPKQ